MIRYGSFLTALVTFLIIALVLFLVVRAVERVMPTKPEERRECPHCLASIPLGASVCQFCTRDVGRRRSWRSPSVAARGEPGEPRSPASTPGLDSNQQPSG